jgi:hypothetical protein
MRFCFWLGFACRSAIIARENLASALALAASLAFGLRVRSAVLAGNRRQEGFPAG